MFFARRATPTGAFPIAVCPSNLPSPVITISTFSIYFSRQVSSNTILIPDSRTAFVKLKNAKPSPPAAPVPAYMLC